MRSPAATAALLGFAGWLAITAALARSWRAWLISGGLLAWAAGILIFAGLVQSSRRPSR